MLVLDTNVLSELLRITPDSMVVEWVAAQPLSGLYTTAITEAEMLYGAHLLAAGPRRRQLEHALAGLFGEDFFSRILAFDSAAARFYAEIAAKRKAQAARSRKQTPRSQRLSRPPMLDSLPAMCGISRSAGFRS